LPFIATVYRQSRRDVDPRLRPASNRARRLRRPHQPRALLKQPEQRVRQEARARRIEMTVDTAELLVDVEALRHQPRMSGWCVARFNAT
jgi:hypothetical protein